MGYTAILISSNNSRLAKLLCTFLKTHERGDHIVRRRMISTDCRQLA